MGITDEFMKEMLGKTKNYCIVILRDGPNCERQEAEKIIWEHGRRNFALRRDGVMPIVCPFVGESDVAGVEIFDKPVDEVRQLMEDDPAVKEGVLIYRIYRCKSFQGDCLP